MRFRGGEVRLFSCGLAAAGILAFASPALAVVKREGTWPGSDPKVSLDVARVPREEAIRKLADAAGWSVVVHAPSADPVDVHVKDQPAGKVLDLLLLDADYVATRDGTLVSIRRATPAPQAPAAPAAPPANDPSDDDDDAPAAPAVPAVPGVPAIPAIPPIPPIPAIPAPPEPPAPPAAIASSTPHEKGRDLDITGDDAKVHKGEIVHDVRVVGGKLTVQGTVTGNVKVMGGEVHIAPGGHVMGDVAAFGGGVRVDDNGRVDGAIKVAGGSVRRGDKAIIGGSVKGDVHSEDEDEDEDDTLAAAKSGGQGFVESKFAEVGAAFARMAFLFVYGTVLLALQPDRMDALKAELVARPMRSFAMGVLGVLGFGAMLLLLCVTVIGVPFALIAAIAGAFGFAASVCAVLETLGRALVRHRTANPYVHLGVGCALFLGATAIPYVGVIVGVVTAFLATGILVTTRGAGLLAQPIRGSQPYRAAPVA